MKERATSGAGADRIELLETFVRIVDAGSLSAAAQLGTSQPTVSRWLQALEQSLGLKLLQRSTHLMKLTVDGERCYASAKELLENWHAMQADMCGAKDEAQGRLRLVVPHAFGQDQLVALLSEYLQRHAGMSVEWLLHDRRPDFIAEGIDCAIQVGAVENPSVVAVRLAEIPRIAAAALALLPFYRDELQLRRLDGGETHRFAIRPRMSTDSLHALRNAALAGLGAIIASSWIIRQELEEVRLVHLAPGWQALPVHLVYPHARFYPVRLRLFMELVCERMPTIVGVQPFGARPGWLRPCRRSR